MLHESPEKHVFAVEAEVVNAVTHSVQRLALEWHPHQHTQPVVKQERSNAGGPDSVDATLEVAQPPASEGSDATNEQSDGEPFTEAEGRGICASPTQNTANTHSGLD